MLWRNAGHDRPIYIVNAILICCSMVLSGYFGWVIGEGTFPLNYVLAVLCASVAYGVSMMFERAAVYSAQGMRRRAIGNWIVGACFAVANIMFDYSSAAALREQVMVAASNQNNMSDIRKSEVKRIEKRIAEIQSQPAWTAILSAPDVYRAEILNLESDATIMKRSANCTNQTLDETRKHCQKIAFAKSNLANAEKRAILNKEIAELDAELVKAKNASVGTAHKADPAMAQVKAISAWFTGERALTEQSSFWGGNSIMLLMTILVNVGLVYLGNEIGHVRAQKMLRDDEPINYTAPRLTTTAPRPTRAADEPIVLVPEPKSTAGTDQLMALALAAMKRYEESPFAKTNGRA